MTEFLGLKVCCNEFKHLKQKMHGFDKKLIKGFSLIEIVLAVSIFGLVVLGAVSSALFGEEAQVNSGMHNRATLLAEESIEAVRSIRSSGGAFSTLVNGIPHGLEKDAGGWLLTNSPDVNLPGGFDRTISVDQSDYGIKKITTTVSWPSGTPTDSVSLTTTITNWRGAVAGTPVGIKVASGRNGYEYMITDQSTVEVYDVSTDVDHSPDLYLKDVSPKPGKVGAVFLVGNLTNIFITGNYAYVTSDDETAQLQIIDITSPEDPQVVATFTATLTDPLVGNDVWVDSTGRMLFAASNNDEGAIYMIDAAIPFSPIEISSVSDTDFNNLKSLAVYEDTLDTGYAYVPANTECLYVFPYELSHDVVVGSFGIPDTSNCDSEHPAAYSSFYNDNGMKALVVSQNGLNFYNVDSDPLVPTIDSTLSIPDALDISLVSRGTRNYAYVSVPDDFSSGLKEIDFTDMSSPTIISQQDSGESLAGVVYDDTLSTPYVFGSNLTANTYPGFISFTPTPLGIIVEPDQGMEAVTVEGAGSSHCQNDLTIEGCELELVVTNIVGVDITYTATVTYDGGSADWITLSDLGNTLSSGSNETVTASINQTEASTLTAGAYTATIHFQYLGEDGNPADITRTATIWVDVAQGIEVRAG